MSIGKSSIARAVNATASKTATTNQDNIITKFATENIGLLSIAKKPDELESVKSSIQKVGVLCPVLTAVTPKGDVWLIDGYRRYYAAKSLGIKQLNATVIKVENKSQANRIYNELLKTKAVIKETIVKEIKTPDIHEEKFRVLCVKDHDLPTYLL